ncbi:AbrB/MazE/SpoVT family DNA-binding domain-containing protein [Candidatus Woesearchaeota archaeon]|nr:AbrB/MazE/SpoVT family DNA-binding domain-containing protein [Candidatus Woesearchaeota archaeon]
MKLQSQTSRVYKGKKYEKFWIVLPSKLIEKLGWKSGQELEAEVKGDKLIIEKDD